MRDITRRQLEWLLEGLQIDQKKARRIKELESENRLLLEKIEWLEHNVEALTQAILHATKQRFGTSSEKTPQTEEQCSIFGEDAESNTALIDVPVITIKEHKRPVRKKGDHEKLTAELPRETIECVLK